MIPTGVDQVTTQLARLPCRLDMSLSLSYWLLYARHEWEHGVKRNRFLFDFRIEALSTSLRVI